MSDHEKQWVRLSSEEGPKLKLFKARWDNMLNPRNNTSQRMIVLESSDSVNVVAITTEQKMVFVRQFRFGIHDYTLELPGGIVDPGENAAIAAARELREETGYAGQAWYALGKVASNPVFMDSHIFHYYVKEVEAKFDLEQDEGEDLEIVELPIEEVRRRLHAGEFQHPHTVNALVLYFAFAEADE